MLDFKVKYMKYAGLWDLGERYATAVSFHHASAWPIYEIESSYGILGWTVMLLAGCAIPQESDLQH